MRPLGKATAMLLLVLLLGLASLRLTVPRPAEAASSSHYVTRAPILIQGDQDFTAANGVTGGSGTEADPYVIEGWEINASASHGIWIRNAASSLIIQDVYVHSGGANDGILLENISSADLVNLTTAGNWHGIRVTDSGFVSIEKAEVESNHVGIRIVDTLVPFIFRSNVTLSGSNGIEIDSAEEGSVGENIVTSNAGDGLHISDFPGCEVIGNLVAENGGYGINLLSACVSAGDNVVLSNGMVGISAQGSVAIELADNEVSRNQEDGIRVVSSESIYVSANKVSYNIGTGIIIGGTPNVTVTRNNIIDNGVQASDDRALTWTWSYLGLFHRGNFWSDYSGKDECSGTGQDICPESDGFGDIPYQIDYDSQDVRPLMEPFVLPDVTPPVIVHLPRQAAITGAPIIVAASIRDQSSLDDIDVYFKRAEDPKFDGRRMSLTKGVTYEAQIPAQAEPGEVLYFILAEDVSGNVARDPPTGMHVVAVKFGVPLRNWIPILSVTVVLVAAVVLVYSYAKRQS